MAQSITKRVGIASIIMMISVLLSRFIGLGREMAIAYSGGASGAVDAYQLSFVIPEILNHIVASGFLSVTFIPIFSAYLASDNEPEGWRIFSIIFNSVGGFLLILIFICILFTSNFVDLIAQGRADDGFRVQVIRMTRIIIPAQFFFFTGGLLMAVQFSKEKFAIPALAPIIYNIGIILCGLLMGPELGMEGFSWGVLIGAFAGNFALQWWGALRVGMAYRPLLNFYHPDLRKYMYLTLPLMAGLTMMFSMEIFIRYFGTYLSPGSVAGLNYGRTILLIPVGLFGQAVGVASYPFMARLIADGKFQEMNELLNGALKLLSVAIPLSVLFMVTRHEIVHILFQRGRFDADATAMTAHILIFLLPGAFALSAYTIVVRGYYAAQNTWFPAVFGTMAVLVSLPIYWYGMQWLGAGGIGLAVSLSSIIQVGTLYALWNHRTHNHGSDKVYILYTKMIFVSGVLGVGMEYLRRLLLGRIDTTTGTGSMIVVLIIGMVFAVALVASGRVLGIKEIDELIRKLLHKVTRRTVK